MKKRVLSIIIAVCMIFTMLPAAALADKTASGNCGANGDNVKWTLKNGVLTISGKGEMADYEIMDAPWYGLDVTSAVIKSGVTDIGESAFGCCFSLKSVTIPNTVTKLKESAFNGCPDLKSVTLPDSVKSIGKFAFGSCESLTSLTIPKNVTSIDESAFSGCVNLKQLNVSTSNSKYSSKDGVLFNKNKTELVIYLESKTTASYTIPNSVKSIGEYAFNNSSNIKALTIPNSVTSIGKGAFVGCSNLESVSIPNSVTSIGKYVFDSCGLKSVSIPNSVSKISYGMFGYCEDLKSVTIPNSVKSIEDGAFDGCDSLSDVYYSGSSTQWKAVKIGGENDPIKDATIHYYASPAPELKITTVSGHPKIYWNAVDGAVKYWVYRSTDGKTFKYYDSTTKTSYTNNSTEIGTTYYYKVKAVKIVDGKEHTSDYSLAKSILCKPAIPTLIINRVNGKAQLKWSTVGGAAKYNVYRSTDGKNFKYWDSTTRTSYTNSAAASGTKYYYRVKAVAVVNGKNVESASSNVKSLMTSLATPSVSITTSNGKPKLTWKVVTGADKYYVYRSTDGKTFSYWDSTSKTTFVNSGAKKNTKYYYKVKAVCASNSNANSAQSSAVSIKATK